MPRTMIRAAALLTIAAFGVTASVQAIAQTTSGAQAEADLLRAYTAQQQTVSQYPLARTYSSPEEAIAAQDRTYLDYQGARVELYAQPVSPASNVIAATSTTRFAQPQVTYAAISSAPLAAAPSSITHIVTKGDTLYSIGRKYGGVKPSAIMNANGLSGSAISIGQIITIPNAQFATTTAIAPTVIRSEPSTSIAASSIVRNVEPVPSNIYAVLPGDTLYSIGRVNCVKAADIAAASNIAVNSPLVPGQLLSLPSEGCAR